MKKYILACLILIIILATFFGLYERFFAYHITVKFSESGPLYINMPVYYKGYKIGRAKEIKPDKDYKYTFVKIVLYPQNPKLPENIIAKAKKLGIKKDYIDLVVSDEPSATLLKKGDIIDGEPAFDIEGFLSDIADADIIIPLLQNFSDVSVSANKTSEEIKNFFSDLRSTLKDNRQNINKTTKNLSKMTSKLNNSITEEKLNNTTSNIDKSSTNIKITTENIKNITENIDCATRNLDKTVAKIDCTISETKAIASNVKVITSGFREVLGKRFAGLRIIFGRPLGK